MLRYKLFLLQILALIFLLSACKSNSSPDTENEIAVYNIVLRAANGGTGGGSINEDKVLFEDRATEIRLLIFETSTGKVMYNKLHDITDFVSHRTAIQVPTGRHDFFFIANETSVTGVSDALKTVDNREQLFTLPALQKIPYNSAFRPDGTTSQGRFLMTAEYRAVVIYPGGTQAAPLPFPGDIDPATQTPTYKVSLIRALSKVELSVKSAVARSASGDEFLDFSTGVKVTSLWLKNIPKFYSLFPKYNFYADDYNPVASFIEQSPNFWDISKNEIPYVSPPGGGSIGGIDVRDFKHTLYIPEYLRQRIPEELGVLRDVPSGLASALTVNTATVAPTPKPATENFAIDHAEFNKSTDSYWLPQSVKDKFSRYSILRNTNYKLTLTVKNVIEVSFDLLPWQLVNKYTYMGMEYNVEVEDIYFTGNENTITVFNAMPNITPPHKVTFEIPAGAESYVQFAGAAPSAFTATEQGASMSFKLQKTGTIDPNVGYLIVKYNDSIVKIFGRK